MSGTTSISNTGPNFIYVDSSYSNITGIYEYNQYNGGYHYNLNNNAIQLYYYNGGGDWYWYFTDNSIKNFNIIIQSKN